MTTEKDTAVAVTALSNYLVLHERMEGLGLANLDPSEQLDMFAFPRVRIPTGGSQIWELPTGEAVRSFDGIIVDWRIWRAWYDRPYRSDEKNPPACISVDNIWGVGTPAGKPFGRYECKTCPLNQFGSKIGPDGTPMAGKACPERTPLFILRPDEVLPWLLLLPGGSYTSCRNYRVDAKRESVWHFVTRFSLGTKTGQFTYSIVQFIRPAIPPESRKPNLLSVAEQQTLEAYHNALAPFLRRAATTVLSEGDREIGD